MSYPEAICRQWFWMALSSILRNPTKNPQRHNVSEDLTYKLYISSCLYLQMIPNWSFSNSSSVILTRIFPYSRTIVIILFYAFLVILLLYHGYNNLYILAQIKSYCMSYVKRCKFGANFVLNTQPSLIYLFFSLDVQMFPWQQKSILIIIKIPPEMRWFAMFWHVLRGLFFQWKLLEKNHRMSKTGKNMASWSHYNIILLAHLSYSLQWLYNYHLLNLHLHTDNPALRPGGTI